MGFYLIVLSGTIEKPLLFFTNVLYVMTMIVTLSVRFEVLWNIPSG